MPEQPVTQWHWILTVQYPAPPPAPAGAPALATLSGTWAPRGTETRGEVYAEVLTHAAAEIGVVNREMHVLFFALEPNQLP